MAQVESMKDQIAQAGAEFAYIAAEKRSGVFQPAKFLAKNPISLRFCSTVTKAYGLYHLIGMDALNIAHPATLVIDRGHTVRYIYRRENQEDRAALEPVLAAAKAAAP